MGAGSSACKRVTFDDEHGVLRDAQGAIVGVFASVGIQGKRNNMEDAHTVVGLAHPPAHAPVRDIPIPPNYCELGDEEYRAGVMHATTAATGRACGDAWFAGVFDGHDGERMAQCAVHGSRQLRPLAAYLARIPGLSQRINGLPNGTHFDAIEVPEGYGQDQDSAAGTDDGEEPAMDSDQDAGGDVIGVLSKLQALYENEETSVVFDVLDAFAEFDRNSRAKTSGVSRSGATCTSCIFTADKVRFTRAMRRASPSSEKAPRIGPPHVRVMASHIVPWHPMECKIV